MGVACGGEEGGSREGKVGHDWRHIAAESCCRASFPTKSDFVEFLL